ncbi:RNA polymerase sigma factor SigJ [Nonomuraea sp. B12E4]|uniref:RNA polymerase sigma factor SigJ n=1 Tax=Nonomuraea sp. B12E4 TaxID=3153564 RepID=UPI00325ED8E3
MGIDRSARLDEEWELHRPAVFGTAYRLLGSVTEAEDVLQDVWLRAAGADLSEVADLRAWLVTVAARISYNVINSARVRKVGYVGPWLPEPLLTGPDVAHRVLIDDSVSTAMLLVMRELPPPERVAFVLHEVFELPFEQIAGVLGRSPVACGKLASRARRRVAGARMPQRAGRAEREEVLRAFRAASQAGDLAALVGLLDPDVVYVADGGGKATAARAPVHGVERVARMLLWFGTHRPGDRMEVVEVNGDPGLATCREGRPRCIDTVEVRGGRILAFLRVANPDKLPGHL